MAAFLPDSPAPGSGSFRQVAAVFLAGEGLPFASILSAERIERVFAQQGCQFGLHGVYTTALMVWSFLSQVLRDGKEASCQAAVARIVSHCQQQGLHAPTEDTGDYCRARAKLSAAAIRDLSCEVRQELEHAADASWLWKGRHHAKLIDGFTFTMPRPPSGRCPPANQARYPHPKTQQPGVGLPIARAVAILSLATACVLDLAKGPYQGKETGETALLRQLLAALLHGKQPRQISFTSTCQYVLAGWMQLSLGLTPASALDTYLCLMLRQIAACEVANRPGRLERSRPQTPPPRLQTHAKAPPRTPTRTS
jgi:putative transposase